jgi:hypothetical protein
VLQVPAKIDIRGEHASTRRAIRGEHASARRAIRGELAVGSPPAAAIVIRLRDDAA